MNTLSKWAALLELLSGAVYGQGPSTNDVSAPEATQEWEPARPAGQPR